ncbi:MAG TPA: hypothetical protein VEA36_01030 [Candidatus Paceibacterota bacterium]|nr:hypothetical protein [Candidatus Paceibacterota bacterium]
MAARHSPETRERVLELGRLGKTYTQIRKEFDIPKSTLSVWFRNEGQVRDRTKQLEHLKRARVLASATKTRQRMERLRKAAKSAELELAGIHASTSVRKALLAMLYWAEGTKSDKMGGLTFTNTDPVLAEFFLGELRATFPIDEQRIRIRIHLHDYHVPAAALAYWSQLLSVPQSQFGKIYVKKRSTRKRFRENFQGICFIHYGDGMIRRELLALARLIAEKSGSRRSMDRT